MLPLQSSLQRHPSAHAAAAWWLAPQLAPPRMLLSALHATKRRPPPLRPLRMLLSALKAPP